MGWNSMTLTGNLDRVGDFSLTVEFRSKKDNFKWHCTSVYGPNARALKIGFQEELWDCGGTLDIPSVVCSDFIAIFALEDKILGAPNLEDI